MKVEKEANLFFLLLVLSVTLYFGCEVQEQVQIESAPEPKIIEEVPKAVIAPFLWKIEGETEAYLYGTMHVQDERVVTLPQVVYESIEESDVLYTEIKLDIASLVRGILEGVLEEGTLADIIPEPLYKRIDKYLISHGVSIIMFNEFKLYVLILELPSVEYMKEFEDKLTLDYYIYEIASVKGKDASSVETMGEHSRVFETISQEEQILLLNYTLNELEKGRDEGYYEDAIIVYLKGDLDELMNTSSLFFPEHMEIARKVDKRMMTSRNLIMTERIINKMKKQPDKTHFFAVGAAHYHDKTGILERLERRGYNITRVEFPESDICEERYINISNRCYLEYDTYLATKKNEYCEMIPSDSIKYDCYHDLALKTGNIEYCSNIPDGVYLFGETKDRCIIDVALRSEKENYCKHLNERHEVLCNYYLAINTEDYFLCPYDCYDDAQKLFETNSWYDEEPHEPDYMLISCNNEQECLFEEIASKKEFSRCSEIEDKKHRNMCVGIEHNDTSVCEDMGLVKDVCYLRFAQYTGNIKHCEKIKNQHIRHPCYGVIALYP